MASAEEAKRLVRRLTWKYGFIHKEMDDIGRKFTAEYRRQIDEEFLKAHTELSHSINILSKQIYGSGARFATENSEPPFISFKIHPDRIVVDCNEDGFTEPDLQAICAVGQSTKSASRGYIGAKGIGFKSVFIAAYRVHIQSGYFSFEFRHNKTDPGLGMIRPIWVDPAETIPSPLTRMTLYIHDQGDQGEIQHIKRIISMQFDEVQETCLLFLRKLQRISLEFYRENGELERSKEFRKHKISNYRVSLETISNVEGEKITQSQIYHITKQTATGLARSDNRELLDTDEARTKSSMAEVVLGFPIKSYSVPLVTQKKHDLFAFLPLRKSDYKFLIHSDFDTNASRQDIVTTSRRNLDLRAWIATAFFQAVLEFCEDPILCYYWPMFLPSPETSSDAFWSGLDHEIQDLMKTRPVLRSRQRTDLRLISDVYILHDVALDDDRKPIFDDPDRDLYLSPNYPQRAVTILKTHGLKPVSIHVLVNLLETDLRSPNSKMHGQDTTDKWHSVVAYNLSLWFEEDPTSAQQRLKSLPLLPLREGEWTSAAAGPVYFPKTKDMDIPVSLDLRVIALSASETPNRSTLFRHLGASEATSDQVRASILRQFSPSKTSMAFATFKSYLHFLYLTHQPNIHTNEEYRMLHVFNESYVLTNPRRSDIYLPGTGHAYSPASLLAAESTAPGFAVSLLYSHTMYNAPARPNFFHPSWERWLCDAIGIRERLRLLSRTGDALSDTFLYVHQHRPEKFLGLFEHLWPHEESAFLENPSLRSCIEDLPAQHLCGVDFPIKLRETWLPLKHLQDLVERYMEYPEQFPFLKTEESQLFGLRWNFLTKHFSVGKDDSLDLLLEILRRIEQSCPEPSAEQTQKVFGLYVAIYSKLKVANDEPGARRKIRKYFDERGILDPDEKATMWTSSPFCLWYAPPNMVTAHSLEYIYSRTLFDEKIGYVERLFRRTLMIRDASLTELVEELKVLRDEGCEDINHLRTLYRCLDKYIKPTPDMRAAFEEAPLIYHETTHGEPGWYKTSDCLWSSETVIRGKAILDGCWESDKSFFVDKLGVKLLTLQMVYDELRQSPQSSMEEIKVAILSFNGLLQAERTNLDPQPIRKAKIFPVRFPKGSIILSSVDVDFAIGDRDKLKAKFQDKINLLDFDLEDIRRLKSFFEWAGLQERYLSNSVRERTSIPIDLGCPISSRNRDLKRKAYYVARPRFEDDPSQVYAQLRTMAVMEIDGISSVLEIFQNRQRFQVTMAAANEHIDDETTDRLVIYVPKERKAQELCFGSVLPRKLAAWLMRRPTSDNERAIEADIVNALTSIFACDRSVLDDVLDDQGIIQVPFENEDESDDDSEDDRAEDQEKPEEEEHGLSESAIETDDGEQTTPTHSSTNNNSPPHVGSSRDEPARAPTETIVERDSRRGHISHLPRPGVGDGSSQALPSSPSLNTPSYQTPQYLPPETRFPEGFEYLMILDTVVETARRTSFPPRVSFDMSDMQSALPGVTGLADVYESFDGLDVMGRFRSTKQLERDKKIGAAGELYVFELLSKLELPNWDRGNWQSTIRKYVTIHPDYLGMTAWNRKETADLVYLDTAGSFTDTLIDCGCLGDEWYGARPKYYIEVKTTTGPCGTPFYMSGNQYQLMGRIHSKEDHEEIYIIFRVFWLNSSNIGLRIYVDPEKLKQNEQLMFREQTSWSITPGPGQS
ncbi:ATPase-like ATP-binding domain [Fusarium albosuccineum]|uniref:ATPase-like ATP-binding domain n=1 Tax=Fusarium albosuccineum TaxID=1237068 RepID=A0A8H4LK08_9HYPO|nr:ATPase-like ATP-binding domain [Fusarium albosuccineum]